MKSGIHRRAQTQKQADVRSVHKEVNDRAGLIDFEGAGYIPESAHCFLPGVDLIRTHPVTDTWSALHSLQVLDVLDEFEQSALSDSHRFDAGMASLMRRYNEVREPETGHWFIGPID